MVKNNLSEGLPRYKENGKDDKDICTRVFNNIDEASSFWRELWKKAGEGNENAEWYQEITAAITNKVPTTDENSHYLDEEAIRNAIRGKEEDQIGLSNSGGKR